MISILRNPLRCIFLFIFILFRYAAEAQSANPEDLIGKTTGGPVNGAFNNNRGVLKVPALGSVNKDLSVLFNLVNQTPFMNPQRGFETHLSQSSDPPNRFTGTVRTSADLNFLFFEYYTDKRTGKTKRTGEFDANIEIMTNSIEGICRKLSVYTHDCDELKFPIFFNEIPVKARTADYTEIEMDRHPFRIFAHRGKPLFAPMTRKEYLSFHLAFNQKRENDYAESLKDQQKIIQDDQVQIKNKNTTAEIKKVLEGVIRQMQDVNIPQINEKLQEYNQKAEDFRHRIAAMSPEESKAPAFIGEGYMSDLKAYGSTTGKPLFKINPDYWNKSLPEYATQLVVITYWDNELLTVRFLQQRVREIFGQIDFHKVGAVLQ